MHSFWLSSKPRFTQCLFFIRLFVGAMLIRHGWGIFDTQGVAESSGWMGPHFPFPLVSAYLGKASELMGGVFLILGLFIRFITIPLVLTMLTIVFIIGNGEILTGRAYPFLLMLVYLTFFFVGPGKWSLDHFLFDRKREAAGSHSIDQR